MLFTPTRSHPRHPVLTLLACACLWLGAAGSALHAAAGDPLAITGSTASATQTGLTPANAHDNNLATRWSAEGSGQWLQLDLGSPKVVGAVSLAWYLGDQRSSSFKVSVGTDGTTFTDVLTGVSSGASAGFETHDFAPFSARYVRITGFGNNTSAWNSLNEARVLEGARPTAATFTSLGTTHPRLFADATRWTQIRAEIAADPAKTAFFAVVRQRADLLLTNSTPVIPRTVLPGDTEINILYEARRTLGRVLMLATAARVTGERAYADRAIIELVAASGRGTWMENNHTLSTAELTLAVALGYDWLHEYLTPEQRDLIGDAIVTKGLRLSVEGTTTQIEFVTRTNNWNQVCNGAFAAAALAVGERDPDLASFIVNRSIDNIYHAVGAYNPDGAYVEGPAYWAYGTTFQVVLIDSLRSILGQDYGLDQFRGFLGSADYISRVTTPTGGFFNYADGGVDRPIQAGLLWFARRLGRPDLLDTEIDAIPGFAARFATGVEPTESDRLAPLALVWWPGPPAPDAPATPPAPLHWYAAGENPLGVHRTAFADRRAVFVGLKGGKNTTPHGHMDTGSYILESDGIRWAVDLDKQNYPSQTANGINIWNNGQTSTRWTVFRTGPESHNILRFNNARQQVNGTASLTSFTDTGPAPGTAYNLTATYSDQVASAARAISLAPDGVVRIQDSWRTKTSGSTVAVIHQWLTFADVSVSGRVLTLRQAGETLRVEILSPANATIEVQDAETLRQSWETPNPGLKRIRIRTTTPVNTNGGFLLEAKPGSLLRRQAATFSTWRDIAFPATAPATQIAPTADPDGDGVPNLLEYAFDLHPASPDPTATAANLATGVPAGEFGLRFPRVRPELNYIVESSTDLLTWSPHVTNPGTLGQPVTVSVPAPDPPDKRFLRLRVVAP